MQFPPHRHGRDAGAPNERDEIGGDQAIVAEADAHFHRDWDARRRDDHGAQHGLEAARPLHEAAALALVDDRVDGAAAAGGQRNPRLAD